MHKSETELSAKEKAFVSAYLGAAGLNATKAAQLAGHQGKHSSICQAGYRYLQKPQVKAAIEKFLDESAMPAREVLARLALIARSSISDVTADDQVTFDYAKAKETGAIHLVKKMKIKRISKQKKTEIADSMRDFLGEDEINDLETETEILHEEIEFEMYSMHEAVRDLGKHHKLFTDNHEIKGELNQAQVHIFMPDNGRS